jgi:hypothetical protein
VIDRQSPERPRPISRAKVRYAALSYVATIALTKAALDPYAADRFVFYFAVAFTYPFAESSFWNWACQLSGNKAAIRPIQYDPGHSGPRTALIVEPLILIILTGMLLLTPFDPSLHRIFMDAGP